MKFKNLRRASAWAEHAAKFDRGSYERYKALVEAVDAARIAVEELKEARDKERRVRSKFYSDRMRAARERNGK